MKKVPIVKIIFTACRQPGIVEHNIVGWLFDSTAMTIEKAIDYIREKDDIKYAKVYVYSTDADISTSDDESYEIKMESVLIHPGIDSIYHLISQSDLTMLFPVDLDGDIITTSNIEVVTDHISYDRTYDGRGHYNVRNRFLQPMQHNIFDRDKLAALFNDYIASNEKAFDALENTIAGVDDNTVGDFRIWRDYDEEFYMLHIPSGTIVGWYKFYHFGRCNFANRDMTIDDLKDFFALLRNQLLEEPDECENAYEPRVRVKEVDRSKYNYDEKQLYKSFINSQYGMTVDD